MVERRGAELDLPALRGLAISGQHHAEKFELLGLQVGLVFLRVLLALVGQRADHGVFGEPKLVHPGQLRKHLQVAPVPGSESHAGLRASRRLRPLVQLDEARPARHQPLVVELKGARQNFRFVFPRQFVGFFKGQRVPRLVELAAGVFLELHAERRHHVEGGMEPGNFREHLHHAPIVLHGVEAGPRENVAAALGVAILRLVHVPQHHQVDAIHRRHRARCEPAPVLHSAFLSCAFWTGISSAKFSVMRSLDSSFSLSYCSCRNLSG